MGMGAILESRCSISLGKNEGRWGRRTEEED
jgi:hypothetical protein